MAALAPAPAEMDADTLLDSLEGSAAEVLQATGAKVETMQKAIAWLLSQQKEQHSAIAEARLERDALQDRCDRLEAQLREVERRNALDEVHAMWCESIDSLSAAGELVRACSN